MLNNIADCFSCGSATWLPGGNNIIPEITQSQGQPGCMGRFASPFGSFKSYKQTFHFGNFFSFGPCGVSLTSQPSSASSFLILSDSAQFFACLAACLSST